MQQISLSNGYNLIVWRKLSIILLFLTLVQSAFALPSLNFTQQPLSHNSSNNAAYISNTHQASKHAPSTLELEEFVVETVSNNSTTQAIAVDEDNTDEIYTSPRILRASASTFTTEFQATPDYVLVIEFFAIKLTAGLFKNLANPPQFVPWFEQSNASNSASRVSGWKDSNILYASRAKYYS